MTGPRLARQHLGHRLKDLRDAAGKSRADVHAAELMSEAKLSKLERGENAVRVADVVALADFYDADPVDKDNLKELARAANGRPGLYEEFSDLVPSWFHLFLDLESAANLIRTIDRTVPGFLQTPEYTEAIYRASWPGISGADIARRVQLRQRRQQAVLGRGETSRLVVILDEGILRRQVGGKEVASAQVQHLRGLNQPPSVDIRVLPYTAGAYPAMVSGFTLFEDFPGDGYPDTAYAEIEFGGRYLETPEQVARCRWIFGETYRLSVPLEEFQ